MKLKDYLIMNHMHVAEFSLKVGISISTLYRFLNGDKPSLKNAYKIEKFTDGDVTVYDLIEED